MFKHLRYCALLLGFLLILLAVGLAVRVQVTVTSTPSSNLARAEVAQAVSELQGGCQTCHTTLNGTLAEAPAVESTFIRPVKHVLSPHSQPEQKQPIAFANAQVNTQLVDLGQRILDLPHTVDQGVAQVSGEFLQVYEQALTTSNQIVVPDILHQIDGIENLLRTLENQALPHTLKNNDLSPSPAKTIDQHHAPSGTGIIGLTHYTLMNTMEHDQGHLPDLTPRSLPQDFVLTTRRRGPPVIAGALLDSVCNGRLSSTNGQSPFILFAVEHLQQDTMSQS